MRRVLILKAVFIILLAVSCQRGKQEGPEEYVLLVSLDGFRWDYTDLYHTPEFDELAAAGVSAERLIPSFPTKTFPNHYTLATGLHPDHHGIINNSFFASDLGKIYRIGDRNMVMNGKAYYGEPIWVTAEQQGVRCASYFWVGSEADIQGQQPTYWRKYDGSVPYEDRIDQVIKWLELPPWKRPGLITLYFDEPDHTGHKYGPEHPETRAVVERMDLLLGYLRDELDKLEIRDKINLIVLSDHGMGAISQDRYVNILDHIREDWTDHLIGGNPVYLIDPAEGMADSITHALQRAEGVQAWQKHQIPGHLNYGNSARFPGILVVADSMWSIGTEPSLSAGYSGGAHGYDPEFTAMHAIFYAEGPAFKQGEVVPAFRNVDVYGIIAHILDLDPAETDGDLERVMHLFR